MKEQKHSTEKNCKHDSSFFFHLSPSACKEPEGSAAVILENIIWQGSMRFKENKLLGLTGIA